MLEFLEDMPFVTVRKIKVAVTGILHYCLFAHVFVGDYISKYCCYYDHSKPSTDLSRLVIIIDFDTECAIYHFVNISSSRSHYYDVIGKNIKQYAATNQNELCKVCIFQSQSAFSAEVSVFYI